jgi:hypothetical protein
MLSILRTQGVPKLPQYHSPIGDPLFPYSKNDIAGALTFDEARRIA